MREKKQKVVLDEKTLFRTKYWKNLQLTITIELISLYFKFLLDMSNCIEKFTVDRERSPIPEERRVVTASWKRLGVVSGLRRTSTLPVVGTFFLRLVVRAFQDVAVPDIECFRIEPERRLRSSRRKPCQIT